jgi:hypothetical protein
VATGLSAICAGTLSRQIQTMESKAQKQGRFLCGRQVLWMIYQQYHFGKEDVGLYTLENLQHLNLVDDDLRKFLDRWFEMLDDIDELPSDSQMQRLFYLQMEKSTLMQPPLQVLRAQRSVAKQDPRKIPYKDLVGIAEDLCYEAKIDYNNKMLKRNRFPDTQSPTWGTVAGITPDKPDMKKICPKWSKTGACADRPMCMYDHPKEFERKPKDFKPKAPPKDYGGQYTEERGRTKGKDKGKGKGKG